MIALYEIADDYRRALDAFADDLATDDDADALVALLGEIEERFETKAAAVVAYSRNLEAEADAFAAEAGRMQERSKQIARKAASLKDYLASQMRRLDMAECKTGLADLKFVKTPWSVEIGPGTDLPNQYLRFKDPEPDKAAIKEALQSGTQIDGCRLVQGERLRIK